MLRLEMKKSNIDGTVVKMKKSPDESVRNLVCPVESASPLGLKNDDKAENVLETAVFGSSGDVLKHLESLYEKSSDEHSECEADSFVDLGKSNEVRRKPVWQDEDDENVSTTFERHKSFSKREAKQEISGDKRRQLAKRKFTEAVGEEPTWAKLKHIRQVSVKAKEFSDDGNYTDDVDSEEDMLRCAGDYLIKSENLPKGTLQFKKCSDLNSKFRDSGIMKRVEFHPNSQVALVACTSGNVNLFQVDGRSNPKIQTVHFDNFPIEDTHFTRDGEQIIVGSRLHSHFFYYDMIGGKVQKVVLDKGMEQTNMAQFSMSPDGRFIALRGRFGHIHILTTKTKEWIGSCKMNGKVTAVTFDPTSSRIYTHGTDGEVYIWDTRNWGRCLHRFYDDGCVNGTTLAASPNRQYLACGSRSGVVNVYDTSKLCASSCPKPEKILLNLTTEVESLKFNSTSEILSMSSGRKDNAVKLVHFPSTTVFSNFPSINENLRRATVVDTSLNSGFLCVANNVGRALLFRLKHYDNY